MIIFEAINQPTNAEENMKRVLIRNFQMTSLVVCTAITVEATELFIFSAGAVKPALAELTPM